MKTERNEVELDFQLDSYDYDLDQSLIANKPAEVRHESRMMIVRNSLSKQSYTTHNITLDIIDELNEGDLVVVNDTKVINARVYGQLANDSRVELLVLELVEDSKWLCLAKPGKKLKVNSIIKLKVAGNKAIQIKVVGIDQETGGRVIEFPNEINNLISMSNFLDIYGEIPLPPYIKRTDPVTFYQKSYQTNFAKNPGAVAAPTAGLHLSKFLISSFKRKGIKLLSITLHVGYGTFKPIDNKDLSNLKLHEEFVNVDSKVIEEIKRVKLNGKKVIAIGTTTVRALESCYSEKYKGIFPIKKNVDLVIKPGFQFKVIDALLTNFHLPKSSLLLLVSAIIGRERLFELYKVAIKEKFRFFSYGDAMFISKEAFMK